MNAVHSDVKPQNALIKYDAACRAVAEAKSLDEVRDLRDKAEALRCYARMAKNRELEIDAAEIRIRAERRLGQLLAQTPRAGMGRPNNSSAADELPTLSILGVGDRLADRARKLAELHDEGFERSLGFARDQGPAEIIRLANLLRSDRKEAARAERASKIAELAEGVPAAGERHHLIHASCADLAAHLAPDSVDFIVTDPPYPAEFLPAFDDLGALTQRALKSNGLLLCMVGQSYLPEIMDTLGSCLTYHWTLAYLTPGGQAVQQFDRKVNAFWKPVLAYSKNGFDRAWFADVAKSDPNDNDKEHHHWGQSVSGMIDLMKRFVVPGDIVVDPFLGGGTTALAALGLGASFIGADIDEQALLTTRARIADVSL